MQDLFFAEFDLLKEEWDKVSLELLEESLRWQQASADNVEAYRERDYGRFDCRERDCWIDGDCSTGI